MCGIFGYVGWERGTPGPQDLSRATNLLRHRGPDDGACWYEPGVYLGHRRLAIIDLNTGRQPMADRSGRYVITFNGEIYNYPELREALRAEGAAFQTTSDTEVILAGYARWGTDVLSRLEGMFAFGIYDRVARTIFLARDRFGEKPLLLADGDGRVAFASEMAPLVAIGVGGRVLDTDALGAYLSLNYVPGRRTMLRDLHRLGPGEWRVYGEDGLRGHGRYWAPALDRMAPAASDGDALDELDARIDRATGLALRSDVPVGLFLSGGVDSSLVARSAARAGRLEAAFCVDIAEQQFSEWPRAAEVARRLDVELVRVPLDEGVLREFVDVAAHLDDPLADSSAMAVWTIARAAGRRLKVVLSGDGGDELFGGYLTYGASALHRRVRPWLPRQGWRAGASLVKHVPVNADVKVGLDYRIRRFLRAMPLETREAHFTWNGTWLPEDAAALVTGNLRSGVRSSLRRLADAYELPGRPETGDLQLVDAQEYLVNDILAKVDRATMAHGLESRAPLLSPAVADCALSLPDRLRSDGTRRTKVALRRLCARHFGDSHAYAPKQGFSIPVHTWLRRDGGRLVRELLAPDRVRQLGVLDGDAVTCRADEHLAGKEVYGWELWGLMVLVVWFEQRVLHPPSLAGLPDLPQVTLPRTAVTVDAR